MIMPQWDQELSQEDSDRAEFIGEMLAACSKQERESNPGTDGAVTVGTFKQSPLFWRRVVEVVLFNDPDAKIEYMEDFFD